MIIEIGYLTAFSMNLEPKDITILAEEKWKRIGIYKGIDYGNKYFVSNHGRVKGKKILSKGKNTAGSGYEVVALCKDGKCKTVTVHRLVGKYFVKGEDDNHYQINHKDGNSINNYYKNLEWTDQSYNARHGYDIGKNSVFKGRNKLGKYRGVTYEKRRKNWLAFTTIKNKTIRIGTFKTELEAHKEYNNFIKTLCLI